MAFDKSEYAAAKLKYHAKSLAQVGKAFNVHIDALDMDASAESAKSALMLKMEAVKKDPELAKLLPPKENPSVYEGALGWRYDKYGNKVIQGLGDQPLTPAQLGLLMKSGKIDSILKEPQFSEKEKAYKAALAYTEKVIAQKEKEKQAKAAAVAQKTQAVQSYQSSKLYQDYIKYKNELIKNEIIKSELTNNTNKLPSAQLQNFKPEDDQLLIQRIGMASNLNVRIQKKMICGEYHFALFCDNCSFRYLIGSAQKLIDSKSGLVFDLLEFCTSHRHDGTAPSLGAPGVAAVEVLVPVEQGRKFRDD